MIFFPFTHFIHLLFYYTHPIISFSNRKGEEGKVIHVLN